MTGGRERRVSRSECNAYTTLMGTKELREKYGGSGAQALSRAVRAEIPGGNEVLDGLDRLNQIVRNTSSPEAGEALNILRCVADAMRAEILRRYE